MINPDFRSQTLFKIAHTVLTSNIVSKLATKQVAIKKAITKHPPKNNSSVPKMK
jgi:hypothetical protein